MNNILQTLLSSKNPQSTLNQMINSNPQMKNNPLFNNALNMLNNGDNNGLENMARNLAKERGIDINSLLSMFKNGH